MVLTDTEIALWLHIADEPINFARAIESAVLAKLKAQEPLGTAGDLMDDYVLEQLEIRSSTPLYLHPPDDVVRDPRVAELEAVLRECRAALKIYVGTGGAYQRLPAGDALRKIKEVLPE